MEFDELSSASSSSDEVDETSSERDPSSEVDNPPPKLVESHSKKPEQKVSVSESESQAKSDAESDFDSDGDERVDSKEARKVDIGPNASVTPMLNEFIRLNRSLGLSTLDDNTVKRRYELISSSKKEELEGMWKELQIAEYEAFVKRVKFGTEWASLILETMKSSGNQNSVNDRSSDRSAKGNR